MSNIGMPPELTLWRKTTMSTKAGRAQNDMFNAFEELLDEGETDCLLDTIQQMINHMRYYHEEEKRAIEDKV